MAEVEHISLVGLYSGQEVIKEQIKNLNKDLEVKHQQNRSSIHDLRSDLQDVCNEVWKLKIKIVGLSVIAGIVTTVITSLIKLAIDSIMKH
jgi:hypothetical protein